MRGQRVDSRPVWFMRQAGRYLPEYRSVRERAGSFLDLCYNPKLSCEVTLQPLRRYDVDAAILFADILVVPHAMGLGLRFEEGEGPALQTVRDIEAVRGLGSVVGAAQTQRVCDTVDLVKSSLPGSSTLIGFCGGPWTVASYMVEGGSSDRSLTRKFAYDGAEWFDELIAKLTVESIEYLSAQIAAGAEVVQIFDSWAGELPGGLARKYVVRPLSEMCQALKERHPQVPVIVFGRGLGVRHEELVLGAGCAAVGLETELPMEWAAGNLRSDVVLQGNLDPLALGAPEDVLRQEVKDLCAAVSKNRHIFNLGHGIRPATDPNSLSVVIETIREHDR